MIQVSRTNTFSGHRDAVYTLQPSGEDSMFFSAAGDGMIVQWRIDKPEEGELIAKVNGSVYAMYFDRDRDLLIAGQNHDGIQLLDHKNKQVAGSLHLTTSPIFDIAKHEGAYLIACGDGSLMVVDSERLVVNRTLTLSAKSARCIAIDPQSGDVAVGYSDNLIRVFDQAYTLKHEIPAHDNSVFSLRYVPGTSFLMSGSRDARLKIWDGRSGYSKAEEIVAHMYAINHIEFSPDAKHFVTCSMDKSIKVWDLEALRLLKVIDRSRHAGHGTSVNKLLWTSFNNQLLSASDDRKISAWHIIF